MSLEGNDIKYLRPVVVLDGVGRVHRCGQGDFWALREVDLEVTAGQLTAIVGPSGSGKSTLLHLVAGLDRPSAGEIRVGGQSLGELSEDGLSRLRGEQIGVVFQFFQLLPTLTAVENIQLAMDFVGAVPRRERRERARSLLARVHVADQADKLPTEMSGGQQQRVAVARALANRPSLLVADEPTGNLDTATADEIMTLLVELARDGMAVMLVTHESSLLPRVDRVVELRDGRVVRTKRESALGRRAC